MAQRLLIIDGKLVVRDGLLVVVNEGDAGDCDCCGEEWRVIISGMLEMSGQALVPYCDGGPEPDDPYSRGYCTDLALNLVPRWFYRNRDYSDINATYPITPTLPGGTLPYQKRFMIYADVVHYVTGTPIPGCANSAALNLDGTPEIEPYHRVTLDITGDAVGPGSVTYKVRVERMTADDVNGTVASASGLLMAWAKSVSLSSGQNYDEVLPLTLDPDHSSISQHPAEIRGDISSGGSISCDPAGSPVISHSPTCVVAK